MKMCGKACVDRHIFIPNNKKIMSVCMCTCARACVCVYVCVFLYVWVWARHVGVQICISSTSSCAAMSDRNSNFNRGTNGPLCPPSPPPPPFPSPSPLPPAALVTSNTASLLRPGARAPAARLSVRDDDVAVVAARCTTSFVCSEEQIGNTKQSALQCMRNT